MDDHTNKSPFLNWTYFYQDKNMDELRQSLLLNMELEEVRLKAQEEIKQRDQQISQLKQLLTTTITERNQAQETCQKLLYEKLLLQQQLNSAQQHSAISSIEDETSNRKFDSNSAFTSSDCDESIVSSPPIPQDHYLPITLNRPLPQKGKLLEAVMKAGPLLQTLLLAGPLPQWRHPPPSLDTYQIPPPPVVIPTMPLMNQEFINIKNCMKRSQPDDNDNSSSPTDFKYQRIVLQ